MRVLYPTSLSPFLPSTSNAIQTHLLTCHCNTHRITHSSSFIQSESNYPLIHHSIPFYEQQTHFLHHLLPSCNLDLTMACLYLRRLLQVTTFLLPTLLLILPIPLQSDHQMLYNLPLIIQVVEIHYFLLKV